MSDITIYHSESGTVEVRLDQTRETFWLRQEQLSQLFGQERSAITKYLRNVFAEGELERGAVCANFAHTAADGKTYQVDHFNLDVIISFGSRVKSIEGTRFRQWATQVLRHHLTQGYTLSRQRFVANARELEAALQLVKNAAQSPELLANGHCTKRRADQTGDEHAGSSRLTPSSRTPCPIQTMIFQRQPKEARCKNAVFG